MDEPGTAEDEPPEGALSSADDQINNDADYWTWDGVEPLMVGCRSGGARRYEANDDGYSLSLDECERADGLPLTGSAEINDTAGTFRLTVKVPDGRLRYVRDEDGGRSVRGTLQGAPVRDSH